MVQNVIKWHCGARLESVSILMGVEDAAVVPDKMDPLCNNGGHNLAKSLIKTNRAHIIEVSSTRALWDKAY